MTKIDLAFNGRFLCRQPTGVDRFAEETIRALDELIGNGAAPSWMGHGVVLTPRGARLLPLRHIEQRVCAPSLTGALWEQIGLPWHARGKLLVSLCNTGPVLKHEQICAIHDATTQRCPESFSRAFRAWYAFLMPILGRRCKAILTVSEFSKREIVEIFRISPGKVTVVREGANHLRRFEPDNLFLKIAGVERPYVLAVSSQAPHKNFKLILDAVARTGDPGFDVVIAGGANARVFASSGSRSSSAYVRWVGYVSNEALRALYQHAAAFIFPSIYEGFGIPPLEAMQEGCPVIASRAASMPEICGPAALYVDPYDPEQLLRTMQLVVEDPSTAARLREHGRERVAYFTWQDAAEDVLATIKRACEAPQHL